MVEALLAEPHGDVEGASAVVAEDDDGLVGVEFLVCAGGHISHGHEDGSEDGGGLGFPRFADIEQEGRGGGFELAGESVDGDFRLKHKNRITKLSMKGRTLGSLPVLRVTCGGGLVRLKGWMWLWRRF